MTEKSPPKSKLKQVRLLLWALIALAIIGAAALLLVPRAATSVDHSATTTAKSSFGGPFTLIGADGKPFSSSKLIGKPYAIYFGFTRCADVCPTTLSRMVRLRKEVGGPGSYSIVFVTTDPMHDGPKEVGQYAGLFNSPIIGLTGSPAQIEKVKKQYGIYAEPSPQPMPGKEMLHSAIVLLFDRDGHFVATIAPDEPDADALTKLRKLAA
jgi:protein SCO1